MKKKLFIMAVFASASLLCAGCAHEEESHSTHDPEVMSEVSTILPGYQNSAKTQENQHQTTRREESSQHCTQTEDGETCTTYTH